MCEIFEEIKNEGKLEGRLVGQIEGQCRIVIQQLTKKLGHLSNVIIEKIKNSTSETINLLAISIFDIESEDDILKIIQR